MLAKQMEQINDVTFLERHTDNGKNKRRMARAIGDLESRCCSCGVGPRGERGEPGDPGENGMYLRQNMGEWKKLESNAFRA